MTNGYKKSKLFMQEIFSLKNIRDGNCVKKQLKIFGIKFTFKYWYKSLLNEISEIKEANVNLNYELKKNIEITNRLSECIIKAIDIPKNITDTKITTNNNDKNIFSALKALNKFYFLPNKGNLGDIMIASNEYQYFDANNFEYEVYDILNKDNYTEPFNIVYGGGGIWNRVYYKEHPEILNIFKSNLLKKCVILSSSFNECDSVINVFDERFTVFCRDKRSYAYCKSLNNKANFIIADDMVIGADFEMYSTSFVNHNNIKEFMHNISSDKARKYMELYQRYCSEKSEVNKVLATINNFNVGFLLRGDNEKNIQLNSSVNPIDLSVYLCGYGCDKGYSYICSKFFLDMISKFNIIVTNRLHIGICAAKLGKEVLLLDISSYNKIREVYNQSLYKFKNVHLTSYEKLNEDLKPLLNKNIINNTKYNFEIDTFKDFILQYASFKNEYGLEKRFLDIRSLPVS